ncbi:MULTISPECIES: polyphosphate kinase 2 [Mesorhizobium]|uniref:ADP/GDP-polyphosphate phosphotransferase n=1 Tax=Mesorhizobium denitrificans TaxID=2294114 RepID=A0A371XDC4_9HYPH|nr:MULTISPECIES: polyphosphate kinase 2 [Mesorhizobium]RFC67193.1 polyphosphate kinase 2 [Mesorhizobium denitrificans]
MKKAKKAEAAASTQTVEAGAIRIKVAGEERTFDINNPDLPGWIKKKALTSGGFPYHDKMDKDAYETQLETLQMELVKMQVWLQKTGNRVLVVFEGRDAAGKGGTIDAVRQYMNPRQARDVALTKPTETERGQWYYQRYVAQFPTAGELVTFDRSWYNRAGVEPVMGFCTVEQHRKFLAETPHFEKLITSDRTLFFKFWLNIGQEMQLKRFHDRRHSPLTVWKFSPMDVAGMTKWEEYTEALYLMLDTTDTNDAPWIVVHSNDKRRARLEVIRHILKSIDYEDRDLKRIGEADPKIIGRGKAMLKN